MPLYDLDVTVNFRFSTEADSEQEAYDWANQWQNRQQSTCEPKHTPRVLSAHCVKGCNFIYCKFNYLHNLFKLFDCAS